MGVQAGEKRNGDKVEGTKQRERGKGDKVGGEGKCERGCKGARQGASGKKGDKV